MPTTSLNKPTMNDYNSHCGFDFGSKSLDFHDVKMQQLKFGKQDYKDFKQISTRTINNTYSGSSLNSNSSSNGIYVDMGKVLLEAGSFNFFNSAEDNII